VSKHNVGELNQVVQISWW